METTFSNNALNTEYLNSTVRYISTGAPMRRWSNQI